MVSDDDALSLLHKHMERVNRGVASEMQAGWDLMRELRGSPLPGVSYEEEVARTLPGEIGN